MRAVNALIMLVVLAVAAGCGGGGGGGGGGGSAGLGTLDPGTIRVAIRGDLPFAAVKDGKLTGVDGDIMRAVAAKLKQTTRVETMDFNGQLGAVSSGRVDVAIGSIGWRKERAQAGRFTDPAYYAGATIIQPAQSNLATLADLKGKTIGTVTGYAWVPAIRKIDGAKLRTYETADAVYADVSSGRLDAAFVDTLQDIYTATVRKDVKLKTTPLQVSPDDIKKEAAFVVFGKLQFPFYLPRQEGKLEQALTKTIREMYASGEMGRILKRWNLDPSLFLTPGDTAGERAGVDRPDGWKPPAAG